MNMRDEWTIGNEETFSDIFYNKEESIQSVKDNFDIRRYYTAEGYDLEINGVMERCLVQTSNNPLRELNDYRKIHCPITADVKRGYYVKHEGTVWIIDTNVANIDGAYLSTRMTRCQHLLRWQNPKGDIIERWGYSSDQTKYSTGETGNNTITVGDNQYCLLLPIDEETKLLKRGMRFAMDFEDSEEPDIYRLTNRKVNLNNELYFDRGGTMTVTLSFDALNHDKDKRITLSNGNEVWICDYIPPSTHLLPPDGTTDLWTMKIDCPNLEIKPTGYSKTLTANLYNIDTGERITDVVYEWSIQSDISEFISYTTTDNILKISLSKQYSNFGDDISITCSSKYTGQACTIKLKTKGVF